MPVEMQVEAPAESASVKRGSDAVADTEERARLRLRADDMQDVLEPQAKTRARLERRRGQKRESTQPLAELEEEVTPTIQGGASSSADVPVDASVAASVRVEDMVQTDVPTSGGTQPARVQLAKDYEKLSDHVLTSNAFSGILSRESVQGVVQTCLEMCAVDLTEV